MNHVASLFEGVKHVIMVYIIIAMVLAQCTVCYGTVAYLRALCHEMCIVISAMVVVSMQTMTYVGVGLASIPMSPFFIWLRSLVVG